MESMGGPVKMKMQGPFECGALFEYKAQGP